MSILGLVFQKKVADFFSGKTKSVVFPHAKNLFNYKTLKLDHYINSTGSETSATGWKCSDYIPVIGGKKLKINLSLGSSISAGAAFYDSGKNLISHTNNETIAGNSNIVEIPYHADFVRFSLSTTTPELVQIEYGVETTSFEDFDPEPRLPLFKGEVDVNVKRGILANKYISNEMSTMTFPYGKNLFNSQAVIEGYYVSPSTGLLIQNLDYRCTDFIPVIGRSEIKMSHNPGAANAGLAFYDAEKTYLSGINNNMIISNGLIIQIPHNAEYIRFSLVYTLDQLQGFQVEYGKVSTEYEPFRPMPTLPSFRELQSFKISKDEYPVGTNVPMVFPHGKNLFDYEKAKDNIIINKLTGAELYSSDWFTSDFISVLPNSVIRLNQLSAGSWSSSTGAAFYDRSNKFISAVECTSIVANGYILTVPAQAFKMRLCDTPLINKYTLQAEYGDSITAFKKFSKLPHTLPSEESLFPFKKIINTNNVDVYMDMDGVFHACHKGIYVRATSSMIKIFREGVNGVGESVDFNSDNFPGLIEGSTIIRIFILPYTRNFTNSTVGADWRLNVVTSKGQVYHNFPARNTVSDGSKNPDDHRLFDEGCIWDLPERWAPVKTTTGVDATLIESGKYKYYPALPDSSYEFHPAISQDNGYGNGGFPAIIEKTNQAGQPVKFARFHQPVRIDSTFVALDYMGGLVVNEKLSVLGTYRSNKNNEGCRICVFYTNDGGRNWFARYEFGAAGQLIDSSDTQLMAPVTNHTPQDLFVEMPAAGSGLYQVVKRSQYVPTAEVKEPINKFKYSSPALVNSITASSGKITIVTGSAHGLVSGDIIVFEKQPSAVSNNWDWLVNSGHDGNSAGDGLIFKVVVVNSTTFTLKQEVHNPHNNLAARHIHSLNKSPHGLTIGCGEAYPEGWILLHNYYQSDNYARLLPWDDFTIIRLNSSSTSAQRPLGFLVKHDGTFIVGMDNESTNVGNIALPEGRTGEIRKSSTGVYKGIISKIDTLGEAECILESSEVAYFFQEIAGVLVFLGQRGHLAISLDGGQKWIEWKIEYKIPNTSVSRYSGMMTDRAFMIEGFLFHLKD